MKAILVREPGGPEQLVLADVPDPTPGPGEVLLDVAATALNRADLLQRRGLYPAPAGASAILGLECAGVVAAVGPGVGALQPGDRVMALLPGGGYAERAVIPEPLAIPVPRTLSFEQAAAIPEAFLTAREALFALGGLEPGALVLIHAAAGGVGSAAVSLARERGARIVATCGSAEKVSAVQKLGADEVVNYRERDFEAVVDRISDGRGADVILDFVGAAYWEKHARCLAEGGRSVLLGLLGGTSVNVDFGRVLRRRQQLLGLVMRTRSLSDKTRITRAFVRESLPLFEDGRLEPLIDSVFALADAARAHERMEQNANIGKIVLRTG